MILENRLELPKENICSVPVGTSSSNDSTDSVDLREFPIRKVLSIIGMIGRILFR